MSQVACVTAGKREQTKLQNRQAILDAARGVFGEMGYEACTVRDIIRRTGLAAGTFYNYYRSKEEVYLALSEDGARRFAPVLKAQRERATDWLSFMRGAIQGYFDFLADEHRSWLDRRPPGEPQPHVYGETPEMAAVFAEVRDAISQGVNVGGSAAADPDYLTAACIAIARDVGFRMLNRRPVDTQAAADFTLAMILFGMKGLAAPETPIGAQP